MELLVSTDWLANEIGASDLRVVDATWFMPDAGRNAQAEYEGGHIPSAVFMDLEELADANSSLPNTLPPPEKFASRMQSLGLGDGSRIVVYDDSPFKSAARAWWMLTLFQTIQVFPETAVHGCEALLYLRPPSAPNFYTASPCAGFCAACLRSGR